MTLRADEVNGTVIWNIDDDLLKQFKNAANGERFSSDTFTIQDCSWRFDVCPNGYDEDSEEHLCLYLTCTELPAGIDCISLNFQFQLDPIGNVSTVGRMFTPDDSTGCPKLCEFNELKDLDSLSIKLQTLQSLSEDEHIPLILSFWSRLYSINLTEEMITVLLLFIKSNLHKTIIWTVDSWLLDAFKHAEHEDIFESPEWNFMGCSFAINCYPYGDREEANGWMSMFITCDDLSEDVDEIKVNYGIHLIEADKHQTFVGTFQEIADGFGSMKYAKLDKDWKRLTFIVDMYPPPNDGVLSWNIKSDLLRQFVYYAKNGDSFQSDSFEYHDCKWCIECYPDGDEEENKDYMSVFLKCIELPENVNRIGINYVIRTDKKYDLESYFTKDSHHGIERLPKFNQDQNQDSFNIDSRILQTLTIQTDGKIIWRVDGWLLDVFKRVQNYDFKESPAFEFNGATFIMGCYPKGQNAQDNGLISFYIKPKKLSKIVSMNFRTHLIEANKSFVDSLTFINEYPDAYGRRQIAKLETFWKSLTFELECLPSLTLTKKAVIWKIDSWLWELFKNAKNDEEYDYYESPEFFVGDCKFQLMLHPDGDGTENKGWISVYLRIISLPYGVTCLPLNYMYHLVESDHYVNIANTFDADHDNAGIRKLAKLQKEWKSITLELHLSRSLTVNGATVIWKIDDWLYQTVKDNPNERYASPEFDYHGNRFHIAIHPNGYGEENEGWMSVFLACDEFSSHAEMSLDFSFHYVEADKQCTISTVFNKELCVWGPVQWTKLEKHRDSLTLKLDLETLTANDDGFLNWKVNRGLMDIFSSCECSDFFESPQFDPFDGLFKYHLRVYPKGLWTEDLE